MTKPKQCCGKLPHSNKRCPIQLGENTPFCSSCIERKFGKHGVSLENWKKSSSPEWHLIPVSDYYDYYALYAKCVIINCNGCNHSSGLCHVHFGLRFGCCSVPVENYYYKYSNDTTSTNPGDGLLKLNDTNMSLATKIFINSFDNNNDSMNNFIKSIALNITKSGFFKITGFTSSTSILYDINAIVDNDGWFDITITCAKNTTDTETIVANNDDVVVCIGYNI